MKTIVVLKDGMYLEKKSWQTPKCTSILLVYAVQKETGS